MRREIALIVAGSLALAGLVSALVAIVTPRRASSLDPAQFATFHESAARFGRTLARGNWIGGDFSRAVDASYEVATSDRVEIHAASSDISLVPASGGRVRVSGIVRASDRDTVNGVRVTMQEKGDRRILQIDVPQTRFPHVFRSVDARFTIAVPRVAALAVVSSSGDCSVSDIVAPLHVETSSGDVGITRANGSVTVRTRSGDVTVRQAYGSLNVDTATGDVRATDLSGAVAASSTSGDLIAGLSPYFTGSSVVMRSASGDVDLSVPTNFRGVLRTNTRSGDVTNAARLPEFGAGVHVDLSTGSGDIAVH